MEKNNLWIQRMKKEKVGILTWHYFINFGSILQAYALQEAVSSLGYDVHIINFRDKKYGTYNSAKQKVQSILHSIFHEKLERL